MSVSYGGDSITFADSSTITSGWTGFKNRVINGAMVIDQRYSGSANTVPNDTAQYVMDRWRFYENTDGVISVQRISSDAPEGYRYSAKVTVSTADTSLSASQIAIVSHRIEGYNMDDFNWGKSTARTATLSFWVKSSLTGKFSGSFYNMNSGSVQRTYVFDYTIDSANTWEKKTVTIVGDTNTNWNSGTDATVEIIWGFGTGSNYKTGTVNQWFTGFASQSTGSVDLIGTLNATWQITGVQFEVGSTASSFEYRPYTTELALCQRYYEVMGTASQIWFVTYSAYSSGSLGNSTPWKVQKCKTPVVTTGTIYAITLTPYDWGFQLYSTTGGYVSPYVYGTIVANAEL